MSRKTRQEKIIADLRRKLKLAEKENQEKEKKAEKEYKEKETQKTSFSSPNQDSLLAVPVSYIKKDLTKTLILTIFAISLELMLYFLTRTGK